MRSSALASPNVSSVFASLPGVRWTRPEALHLTLRFFGEWPEERLAEMTAALEKVERLQEPLRFAWNASAFCRVSGLHASWLPLDHAGATRRVSTTHRTGRARQLGFEPERRAFLSHVTLARLRDPRQGKKLVEAVRVTPAELGARQPTHWALYQSKLTPAGAQYAKLAQWPLFPS
ncbi:MAG: RNA 2',3'-cyclic phosphodiesterase [Bryobacterales bacterium]